MWLIFLSRMWSGSIRSPQTCAQYDRITLSYQNHVLEDILEMQCERGGDHHIGSDPPYPAGRRPFMDRREILADNPMEKRRGYMPGVSVSPGRILFTAGMTGRQADGTIVSGGMAAQTQRTMERLQAILQHAGANFSQVIKQLLYITDMEAHAAS